MAYRIEVDFDVYRAVFARRATESVTENDVLRELLNLPPKAISNGEPPEVQQTAGTTTPHDWVVKGIRFPGGTDFRASYKGKTYTGRVQGGSLVVEGKPFDSPSAAAIAITGNSVNGWRFWECRRPGESKWQSIESLRL